LLLPAAMRLSQQAMLARGRKTRPPLSGGGGTLREGLSRVLARHREALDAAHDLCLHGQRRRGRDCEHVLADSRAQIESLFSGALTLSSKSTQPEVSRLRQAALATVQLQRALEELLRHAEKSTEQGLALSPAGEAWKLPPQDQATLKALHSLLSEGLT